MTAKDVIALTDLRQKCAAQMAGVSIPLLMVIAKQLGLSASLNHAAASNDAGKPWGAKE